MGKIHKLKTPLVSVVIPTYNSGRTIEKCLRSIQEQTYKDIEIIVVDSPDYNAQERDRCKKTIQIYANYFVDGPERSIQRNRGIQEAKGKYVLVIDQDMYLDENVVAECVNIMEKEKYVALMIPEISIGEGFWTRVVALDRYITVYLETGMNECCRFFKKKDALNIGGYDPSIVGAEDSDFHYRLKKLGEIGKVKSIIYHDEGRTRLFGRIKKKYYYSHAFKKYLDRYPDIAVHQFNPIKPAYFKHLNLLVRDPLAAGGIIILRSGEVLAGALGILIK